MKILFLLTISLILICCGRKKQQQQAENGTPHSLEQHESKSLFSKRAPGDLVEDLYSELVSDKSELQKLEKDIEDLADRKNDSLSYFNDFDNKNDRYYSSAQMHASQIQDSALKKKMIQALEDNLSAYEGRIASIKALVKELNQKQLALNDHHIMLKLILTMAMMEKFQKNNLPSSKSLEPINSEYDKLTRRTDSLAGK